MADQLTNQKNNETTSRFGSISRHRIMLAHDGVLFFYGFVLRIEPISIG